MHTNILVIEDNSKIRRFIKTFLQSQGYDCFEADNAGEGVNAVKEYKPNVILLDLGLPDKDGLSVIYEVRQWTDTPIIVLSARDQEHDKVMALDMGADDYLTKPFSIPELHSRLKVAIRHARRVNDSETTLFRTENLQIDILNHKVWLNRKLVTLTPTQFAILTVLVKRVNKIVTHQELLKEIWGDKHIEDIDYLRIYMHQIRHKLEANPSDPVYFKTEPGIGYRLVAPPSDVDTFSEPNKYQA